MRRGFTLIELLAVIVILAIIALIATPIVLNIINETKESASLRSAEMYLNAVEYAIADIVTNKGGISTANYYITPQGNLCEQELVNNKCSVEEIEIKVKGEKPTSGKIEIKGMKINTAEVVLSEKTIQKTEEGKIVLKQESESTKSICTLASDSEKTGTELGAKYECEVKPGTKYTFFVLSNNEEDGSTNLIMDRNMCDDGTPTDSQKEDKCATYWGSSMVGPAIAMTYLHNATKNWKNVPNIILNYTDEGYGNYGMIITEDEETKITKSDGTVKATFTNLKARLPYQNEITGYNGENGYLYDYLVLYNNIQKNQITYIHGYWTLSSNDVEPNEVLGVLYSGGFYTDNVHVTQLDIEWGVGQCLGVHPVITVNL